MSVVSGKYLHEYTDIGGVESFAYFCVADCYQLSYQSRCYRTESQPFIAIIIPTIVCDLIELLFFSGYFFQRSVEQDNEQ